MVTCCPAGFPEAPTYEEIMSQYGDLERLKARIGPELAKLRADQRQAGHRCVRGSLPQASGQLPACVSILLLCISRLRHPQGLSWRAQRRSVAGRAHVCK